MINSKEELDEIVEMIKATLGIEELDELERQYNEMYQRLKEEEEKKASTTKAD